MKNKVLKSAIIILLLVVITMADFMLVGKELVTYALKNMENSTNHENVEFAVYFKTEEGEKSNIDYEMNSNEMKLCVKVAVENEGCFDGVITLEDSNFKFKKVKTSEYIKEIEENRIVLDSIRAERTVELELGIEPIIEESYNDDMLNKNSILKLTGEYLNSEDEKTSIESEKSVALSLTVPNSVETTFKGKVITNRIYQIGEDNKRIVQLELNSGVVENIYPIKATEFEVQLPEGVEEIEVITKGTYATDGKAERKLDAENYEYNEEANILKINIANKSENGKISWKKNTHDSLVVTLLLAEDAEVTEEYTAKAKVAFEGKELEKEQTYNLSEEADGIIRASIENKEEIYKGKIYSGEEREYKTTTNIEINYANLIEASTIEERTLYRTELEDKATNIEYKTTTIKKSEIEKILGTEGTLLIQNGTKQEQITAETEADENGNIVIAYETGVKNLNVVISKAVETGIIRLNHTKVIKAESYSKEEIDAIKNLVEVVDVKYTTAEYTFEKIKKLKDVTSEVAVTVTPQTISSESNKEMQITLTLKAEDEKYELFKNPTFAIVMPEGITVNSVTNGTISATDENLVISKLEPISAREIRLEITGEQQKYVTSDINPQVSFTANVNIEKLMPNKTDTIGVQYINQGNAYAVESDDINIVASNAKVVTHLKLENYNGLGTNLEKYSDSNLAVNGKIQMNNSEVLQIPVKYTIINNYDSAIALAPVIIANKTDKEENNIELLNYMSEEITIEAGKMEVIEQVIEIPAGLYFSETIDVQSLVEYNYSGTKYSVPNAIHLATEEKEGIRDISLIDNKLQVETFMQLGDKTGVKATDEIYNEQVAKYIIQVTNITNKPISNITITNNHENGNIYDLMDVVVTNKMNELGEVIEHEYAELDTSTKTFEIVELNPGETRELVCRVVVKKTDESDITTANISVSAEGINEESIAPISNTVKDANIKVITKNSLKEEVQIYSESALITLTTIENLKSEEITDLKVKMYLSDGIIWNEDSTVEALDDVDEKLDIIGNVEYNVEENYVEIEITKLKAKQKISLSTILFIERMSIDLAETNEDIYVEISDIISNNIDINVKQLETEVKVEQFVNINEDTKLKNGEKVIITGKITNIGAIESIITLMDDIHEGLEVDKITLIQDGQEIDKTSDDDIILFSVSLNSGETIEVKIEATINTSKIVEEKIENVIVVSPENGSTRQSNAIVLNIESTIQNGPADEETVTPPEETGPTLPNDENSGFEDPNYDKVDPEVPSETPENPSDNPTDTPEDPEDEPAEKPGDEEPEENVPTPKPPVEEQEEPKYTISGLVWVDRNQNNILDKDESLKDVTVKLIDLNNQNTFLKDESGKEIEIKTNDNGEYAIRDIPQGKYNVIFKYDTSIYELGDTTQIKDYIIETTKEKVAITNNIDLLSDALVDLRLFELTEFNLKIDKYISKVIIQTQKETKTIEYQNKQLVREEILSKYISGATVLVEYTMNISNVGELAGYATEIVDYIPNDMKYHSELNTQWYEGEDGYLYNTSLATTVINPGETKAVKLVLLKTMTRENGGTTQNTAEISESMNIKAYPDINLTDNQSRADIIISTATGSVLTYLIVVVNSILIVAAGAYLIKKKIIK